MSRDSDGKLHVCERCRTGAHELYYYRARDEYLCDNCISSYEEEAKKEPGQ